MTIPTGKDIHEQLYWDIEDVRITSVKSTFVGTPGLRIQSFQKNLSLSNSMYIGVEVPIPNGLVGLDFLSSIINAVREAL